MGSHILAAFITTMVGKKMFKYFVQNKIAVVMAHVRHAKEWFDAEWNNEKISLFPDESANSAGALAY